jgi:histone H3/H4
MEEVKADTPELLIGTLAIDRVVKRLGVAFPESGAEELANEIGSDAVALLVEVAEKAGNVAARDFLLSRKDIWRS